MNRPEKDANRKNDCRQDAASSAGKRLAYKQPKLKEYGSMAKLTQGTSTRSGEGGASRNKNG
jgi:hypothetical protein